MKHPRTTSRDPAPHASSARRRFLGGSAAVGATALWPWAAGAAEGGLPTNVGHNDSSRQWEKLRDKLYGSRAIEHSDASALQLVIPLRAAYGASVPVKFITRVSQTQDRYLKQLRFIVDKNPSAIAATLNLTPELGQANFETRLRVDEYSHVRAIGEFNDGSLHMASRFVKVSGGCSAPPNRETMHLMGRTTFRLPEGLQRGQPTPVDLTVMHPNDTGFELNNITVMFIPPHFVRRIKVNYGDKLLFDADQDFSVAENPSWRFMFAPRESGVLTAEVEDSKEQRFSGRFDPAAQA
jgi:sulfur-oxidizing protein SoxY